MPEPTPINQHFFYVSLSSPFIASKPIDIMAAGTFTDMWGRTVTFRKEDFPTYLANTQAAIEATRDSNGEVVGLPIDMLNHENREAAGWITGVELAPSGDVLLGTPRWNEEGREVIGGELLRFFSPTVDIVTKTCLGGSLTNWPATRNEKRQNLLRPIELSMPALSPDARAYSFVDESLPDRINRIARAFIDRFTNDMESQGAWPVDVFDGYLICELGDKLYRCPYWETADGLDFAAREEWVEVKRSYVEAALRSIKEFIGKLFAGQPVDSVEENPSEVTGDAPDDQPAPAPVEPPPPADLQGDEPMPVKLTELSEEDRQSLVQQVAAELTKASPAATAGEPDLAALTANLSSDLAATIQEQYQLALEKVKREAVEMAAQVRHEGEVAELVTTLTGGTADAPFGLAAKPDELKTFLLSLNAQQYEFAAALLSAVQKSGPVDFQEHGHAREIKNGREMPREMAAELKKWLAADKENTVDEFFKINAVELGAQSDYNLSEFEPKEK